MRISSVLTSQATTPHTRDAWSVMREAWCVLHDSTCTSKSDAWCVKVIFADGATQCGSPGAYFTHRDMAPIYLNINVSTAIASAILSQMLPIRMLSLYSFNKVLYSAGCSSTRLVNFSRYLSSITSLYINHHKSSTNDYVMYKWVSTWLSVDHMQGSWGARENPSNDVMVGSRDACWPLPERWIREPKTNTHHAWRACGVALSIFNDCGEHASRFTHHAYVESWLYTLHLPLKRPDHLH